MPDLLQAKQGAKQLYKTHFGSMLAVTVIWVLFYGTLAFLERSIRFLTDVPQVLDDGSINLSLYSTGILIAFAFIRLLLLTPVTFGVVRWMGKQVYGGKQKVGTVFWYYADVKRFGHMVAFALRGAALVLLHCLPFAVCAFVLGDKLFRAILGAFSFTLEDWAFTVIAWLDFALWVAAAVSLLIGVQRLLLAANAFTGGVKVAESFRTAKVLVSGRRFALFRFLLSFFGWGVLSLLIVPVVYTGPYFLLSQACLYRQLYAAGPRVKAPKERPPVKLSPAAVKDRKRSGGLARERQ